MVQTDWTSGYHQSRTVGSTKIPEQHLTLHVSSLQDICDIKLKNKLMSNILPLLVSLSLCACVIRGAVDYTKQNDGSEWPDNCQDSSVSDKFHLLFTEDL